MAAMGSRHGRQRRRHGGLQRRLHQGLRRVRKDTDETLVSGMSVGGMLPARYAATLGLLASLVGAQTPADNQPTPVTTEERRPRMAGSSTGYIDEAIVGSEIRFRFDADFDLRNPDRAEFFYAKCGCYRNGSPPLDANAPGPGTGIAKSVNLQELQLHLEYAPNRRISVFVETPVRFIQYTPSSGSLS